MVRRAVTSVIVLAWCGLIALAAPGATPDDVRAGERQAGPPALPPYVAGAAAPPGYRLVWADEFDGDGLDAARWNVRENQNYGATLGVDQCYRAANVRVAEGVLKLQLRRETVACGGVNPDTGDRTYHFTSGGVTTRAIDDDPQRFAFTRGYVEAAIRLPQGNAYWGAFWHTGGDGVTAWPDYGEFDTMEQVGPRPDQVIQTVHYRCAGRSSCDTNGDHDHDVRLGRAGTGPALADLPQPYQGATTTRMVRYGLLWDDESVTWYVDGVPVRSFDGHRVRRYGVDPAGRTVLLHTGRPLPEVLPSWSRVLATPHSIELNLAYGGELPRRRGYTGKERPGGYDDGNRTGDVEGVMQVDYVRVYQSSS